MRAAGVTSESGGRRRWRRIAEFSLTLLAAVALAGGIRTFAFQVFEIPTSSMEPTLAIGDRIIVQKAFFSWHDVHQGDIIVFSHPPADHCGGPDTDLVKRVVAVGGQTIYSIGNNIFVNGKLLKEPYLPHPDPLGPPIPDATKIAPYRVPSGDFYVLGDNRAISCDSRYWGPIKGTMIVGKMVMLLWHDGRPGFM